MKKKLLILSFLFMTFAVFAKEPSIESGGWHWDTEANPNKDLASSVKALMKQRKCDVSVALITRDPAYPYVVINNYDKDSDSYWTDIIPLIR